MTLIRFPRRYRAETAYNCWLVKVWTGHRYLSVQSFWLKAQADEFIAERRKDDFY